MLSRMICSEDSRRLMSDAEIMTTALVSAMFFNGNQSLACSYMKEYNLILKMLEKSRFNRRLHNLDIFNKLLLAIAFNYCSDSPSMSLIPSNLGY